MNQKTKPLVKNAADPEQVNRAEIQERLRHKSEDVDLKSLLSLPQGERFLWRVLSECGMFATSYHADSGMVYLNEGKRQIGLWLLANITRVDEQAFIRMMTARAKEHGVGDNE